jgi:iron complex transport system permease protein
MRGPRAPFVWLAALLLAALAASVLLGAAGIGPGRVWAVLRGAGDEAARTIVLDLRLPRALLAVLVGGALGASGAVFQALLRNPLAEPYILGVSGGAAVGAVGAIVLGAAASTALAIPAAAFIGALAAIALVFRVASSAAGGLDTRVLLLAGVVVGAFFNALILLLLSFADTDRFRSAFFWMMGSLGGADWPALAWLAVWLVPAVVILLALARSFDLLSIGEDAAMHLGVDPARIKVAAYLTASLAVAASVAVVGVIGFIGLVVPHALRLAWRGDHRFLIPASFLAGSAFLLVADTVARVIVAPAELPVGVVTALVGVPVFVVLLRRRLA